MAAKKKRKKKIQPKAAKADRPADSAYCRVTHSYLPDSKSRLLNLGAYFLWKLQLGRGLGGVYWTMKFFFVVSGILGGLALWKPQDFLPWFELSSLLGLFIFAVPYLFFSSFLATTKNRLRIFSNSDFWLAIAVVAIVAEDFPLISSWTPYFALSFIILWIWMQYLEAKTWKLNLSQRFENSSILWHSSINQRSPALWMMLLSTSIYVALCSFYRSLPPSSLFLAYVTACSPVGTWVFNKILKSSEINSWKVFDWNMFKELRFTKILLSHFQGVFTQPDLELKNIWIEKSNEWPESVVKEILYRGSQRTPHHPVSQCILRSLKQPAKALVELEEVNFLPHLGIIGKLRDVQGGLCDFSFGSLPFQRILQTAMGDEGRNELKIAIDSNHLIGLLAVNGTIIASVSFEAERKSDLETGYLDLIQNFRLSISSSASMKWLPKPLPAQIGFDLFPIERKIAVEEAVDRFHQFQVKDHPVALELLSRWDEPSTDFIRTTLMDPDPTFPAPQHSVLQIYGRKVSNFLGAYQASRWFARSWAQMHLILFILSIVMLLLPKPEFGALLLLFAYLAGIVWIKKTELQ